MRQKWQSSSTIVCFVTKAIHIEFVGSLSATDFLNALNRFIARREMPSHVYSNNATNFRGAATYIRSETEELHQFCLKENIHWSFIPCRAPHRGGLWEAAVKAAKMNLVRVMKSSVFTYEQFELRR